jgi:hypothetical protein
MPLGITKGISSWDSQRQTVERHTDNAAYTSAHPDDTLVLAGPPRNLDSKHDATEGWQSLLAIGMLQGFQFSSQKPSQPLQAIGSGRTFFVSGKSQTSWNIGRLFCNGRNLLRALYHNAVAGGVDLKNFDDKPVDNSNAEMFFMNLDSELFYVPFGLAAIFRTKMRDLIGAVYLELNMVQSYSTGFSAGQNMIMENVTGMCDRIIPFHPTEVASNSQVPRATVDQIIGFSDATKMLPTNGLLREGAADFASTSSENEGGA